MATRFLVVTFGIVIAANMPAGANTLRQYPVLTIHHPLRIALPDFVVARLSEAGPARAISRIIASDLKQSEAFALVDPAGFAGKDSGFDEAPHFSDWRDINAQGLLVGRVTRQADGRILVEFRFYDTFVSRQLLGRQYIGAPEDIERVGHIISGDVYERVTGKKRTFD